MPIPDDLVALPTMPYDERPSSMPLDREEVRTALWMVRGNISGAAKIMKVSSSRLRSFVKASPYLSAEVDEAKQQLVDIAESNVYEALLDEDPGRKDAMTRFVLASQGRERGWGNGAGGVKGTVQIGNINITWGDGSSITEPTTIEGTVNDA